jgi:type VI secretion system secreted protein VgrG
MDTTIGPVTVTPLSGNPLHCLSLTGTEELGRLFEYNLELLCTNPDITLSDALGQSLTVTLNLALGFRYFNGYISRFSFTGTSGRYAVYRATLRPWLWFLTTNADCRIYPDTDVPTIVKRVFGRYQQASFEGELAGFPKRDYVVQYRETDFNFVSRLMEEEGIYYYFKHEATKHTLVFADSIGAHQTIEGATLPYRPPTESSHGFDDHFSGWRVSQEIQSAGYATKDYDFTKPKKDLTAVRKPQAKIPRIVTGEIYDYPGGYLEQSYGETLAAIRINELQTPYELVDANGTTRVLGVGQLFTLTDYPRAEQNREYLAVKARYEIRTHDPESKSASDEELYRGSYTLIDSKQEFRPARRTSKPMIQGPQTAVVVGDKKTVNDGTEIWTDEYARVKVRFFWERLGAEGPPEEKSAQDIADEDRTCWVRVSQLWAGSGWGGLHVPRIGQEVLVDFLEGDPDKPIITGRVYNDDNRPPYINPKAPTDSATQSGIRSHSSPKGGPDNFNEIKFEDKKGKEELHIQAERDQSTHVKRNQSISVDGDRSVSVGGNETISVTGTRTSTITKKETQTFKDARTMTVQLTDNVEITGAHTGKYHAGRTETVESGDTLTVVGSNKKTDVDGAYEITAKTAFQVIQAGINKILVKDEILLDNAKCQIDLKGGDATITAAESITLQCGGASIKLTRDGTIEISGAQKVKADGAGAGLELTAAGATMSGTKATVSGAAMTEITGGMVKVN